MAHPDIRTNDVVQLTKASNETFVDCLMLVEEVRDWGMQGYVTVPGQRGRAYYRAGWSEIGAIWRRVLQ